MIQVDSQYDQGRTQYYTPAPVAILMHKQALGQDGSFNYAFSAENGLQQGEIINPDGSRTGSYSYVDPSGKTISLKYTAGKDGFRVLEGDHIPRPPPLPIPVQPANNYYQPAPAQPQVQHYDGLYRGHENIYRGNGFTYEPAYRSATNYGSPALTYNRPQYSVEEGNDERRSYSEHQYRTPISPVTYSSEEEPPKGPHSFGSGYSFEFSG